MEVFDKIAEVINLFEWKVSEFEEGQKQTSDEPAPKFLKKKRKYSRESLTERTPKKIYHTLYQNLNPDWNLL